MGRVTSPILKSIIMSIKSIVTKTSIECNNSYEGETIEAKMRRVVNNKEPITDGAPIIFTERKDGVKPEYDIRTDRWDIAIDAMDKVSKSHLAKREKRMADKEAKIVDMNKGGNVAES